MWNQWLSKVENITWVLSQIKLSFNVEKIVKIV